MNKYDQLQEIVNHLSTANLACEADYPGESPRRQPVHVVYGGAHLFKPETAANLGAIARRSLETYAPDFISFAQCVGLPTGEAVGDDPRMHEELQHRFDQLADELRQQFPDAWLAHAVYGRVLAKLEREPVEDFRIDFEDGYGNRPDAEEDGHAAHAAQAVARGLGMPLFPPFIGIRIKPLSEGLRGRSIRTLDIFLITLLSELKGRLPEGFTITLPKVTSPAQVKALVELLNLFEAENRVSLGTLRLELMIETPQSLVGPDGEFAIPALLRAAAGRCRGLHFGVFDYTAALNITAEQQSMAHPAADFARHVMQVSSAGRGVDLSDSATNILPVAPHRQRDSAPLSEQQRQENSEVVRRAMRLHFEEVQRSLRNGFYQGWDLHPAQLPTRYAAVYAFFLRGFDSAAARLRNFIERAAQATMVGDIFDDAATGQALLNYFLRALNSGAISEAEALSTGLTLEELRGRSFLRILNNRGRS
jgi:citrate lyase beta subunit